MRTRFALFSIGIGLLAAMSMIASCQQQGGLSRNETTYANLAPNVQYTGRESCQPCHKEVYASYLETGMGKSLYVPDPAKAIEDFGPEAFVIDGFSGYGYRPYWQGKDLMLLEFRLERGDTTYRRREKIDYIVGSGHQTRSYILDRKGYFYEAPITWYVGRRKWDLSPGYENGRNTRFDREIGEECMACHTGKIDFASGTKNFFEAVSLGIDCEKCHGPGQEHIARMEREEIVDVGEEIDYSIVNPAKLPMEMQVDVCMQCHLQGVTVLKGSHKSVLDYRPGMSLSSVFDVFVEQHAGEADFGIASHAERMMESKCFKGSEGKLGCTTCHDPHKSIALTGPDTYNNQCQSCHAGAGASKTMPACAAPADLRATRADDCVGCHMRKAGVSDIPHVTFTDHRIRVLHDTATAQVGAIREFLKLVAMTDSQPAPATVGKAYLKYFEQVRPEPVILAEAESRIDQQDFASQAQLAFFKGNHALALPLIDKALKTEPGNRMLQFRKAEILEAMGRNGEAKSEFRDVYAADKRLTEAGQRYASLILKTATAPEPALSEARKVFLECLTQKPFDQKLHANLGFVELNAGDFQKAEEHLLAALATHPDYALALENMVLLQVQKGDKAKGKAYLGQLARWQPDSPKLESLRKMLGE